MYVYAWYSEVYVCMYVCMYVDLVDEKSEHFHTADQIAVELGIRQFHLPLSQERAY